MHNCAYYNQRTTLNYQQLDFLFKLISTANEDRLSQTNQNFQNG